jgi:RNA polymerase sigma-70 factor (ECF subfamily)
MPVAPPGPSDRTLLARYRGGSQDAATQLYLRYAGRLRGLARAQMGPTLAGRVDLDDVVQSVFGSFFRRAGDGHYDVPDGAELWGLFLVLALHKIRGQAAFHAAARRDAGRTVPLAAGPGSPEPADGGEGAARAFLDLAVAEALDRLTPAHRRVVELRVEGFEVADIAARTGRSRRSTERLLQEARARLRDLLGGEIQ